MGAQGCSVYTHVHLTLGGSGTWRDEKWYSTNHSPFTLQPADSDNDWVLDDPYVSQHHAMLTPSPDGTALRVTPVLGRDRAAIVLGGERHGPVGSGSGRLCRQQAIVDFGVSFIGAHRR